MKLCPGRALEVLVMVRRRLDHGVRPHSVALYTMSSCLGEGEGGGEGEGKTASRPNSEAAEMKLMASETSLRG